MKCIDCDNLGWVSDEGEQVWGWCRYRRSCPDPDIDRDCPNFALKRPPMLQQLKAENEKLRAELEQVKAERDAAIKELDEVTSEVDDLADFVDREIHPVIDYNLYLDLRENVDAVSMFQHEDEWRGLHKEE